MHRVIDSIICCEEIIFPFGTGLIIIVNILGGRVSQACSLFSMFLLREADTFSSNESGHGFANAATFYFHCTKQSWTIKNIVPKDLEERRIQLHDSPNSFRTTISITYALPE